MKEVRSKVDLCNQNRRLRFNYQIIVFHNLMQVRDGDETYSHTLCSHTLFLLRQADFSKQATTVGGITEGDTSALEVYDCKTKLQTDDQVHSIGKDKSISIASRDDSLMLAEKLVEEEDDEEEDPQKQSDEGGEFSLFLFLMVCVTAVTGFLMGYDLCIVAVVLGPVRDHFGLCEGQGGTEALGAAQPCVMNELFVAILAPGAMVRTELNSRRHNNSSNSSALSLEVGWLTGSVAEQY